MESSTKSQQKHESMAFSSHGTPGPHCTIQTSAESYPNRSRNECRKAFISFLSGKFKVIGAAKGLADTTFLANANDNSGWNSTSV